MWCIFTSFFPGRRYAMEKAMGVPNTGGDDKKFLYNLMSELERVCNLLLPNLFLWGGDGLFERFVIKMVFKIMNLNPLDLIDNTTTNHVM